MIEWSRPYSDLDLLLTGPDKIPRALLFQLEEAFEQSALPYRVDILDAHRIAPSFLSLILEDGAELDWRTTA
ncbi:hypothetical protein [Zobellella iuensis]|uniref:Polymerase nucleotidyl transferase domain-containing protein n=1 Tax=Zobellella iuensis TaxID=2803811 RepID=A0ABS1QNW6_9GAMM|nr:hypothetical protein [Zobellella iuensis]MBL1376217.1 hypothetical protein [Zobellella iuensis]